MVPNTQPSEASQTISEVSKQEGGTSKGDFLPCLGHAMRVSAD